MLRLACVAGGLALFAISSLNGCAIIAPAKSCVSWAGYESPNAAMKDAQLVVVGTSTGTVDTAEVFGEESAVHEIQVDQVLKGDWEESSTLLVVSVPPTCSGDVVYPDGDPLEVDGQQIYFLTMADVEDGWRTLSPDGGRTNFTGDVDTSLAA